MIQILSKWPNKIGDRSKLDIRRSNAKREVALVMVTGNVFLKHW